MYQRPMIQQKMPAQRKSDLKKFFAPTGGWVSNRNLSLPMEEGAPQGAAVLDNFFPTATTAILRRGKDLHATLGDGSENVEALFTYSNGLNRRMFGATEHTIYDITNVLVPYNYRLVTQNGDYIVTQNGDYFGQLSTEFLDVWNGATGGNWITVQFATTGGVFLLGVNGASEGFVFDGNAFYPYTKGGVWALSYDNLTTDFTVGETITGADSGATGVVFEVLPGGGLVLRDIVTTTELYKITFSNGSQKFTADANISGASSRAFGTIEQVVDRAEYDLPYYRVTTAIPLDAVVTGSISGATAKVVTNTAGATQWRIPFDYGSSLFKAGENVKGQTSNASAKVVRIEDYTIEYDLTYDGGTAAFAAGTIVTGTTSTARAEVVSVEGTTAAGKLIVKNMFGVFRDNEPLTGNLGGAALVNGTATGGFSAGFVVVESLTGVFADNEIIKGATQGSATVNGTVGASFQSGVLRVSDLTGNFVFNDVLTGVPSGQAIAVSQQGEPIYSGTLTLRNVGGTFTGGERITQSGSIFATATSTNEFVGGGSFRDDEVITGDQGGSALASSNAINLVPGISFPDGLTTADMSYIWAYKNRIWFGQKDSLNIWYMDAPDAVGGSPAVYPMGGILNNGGSVTWGAAWAMGTGAAGGLSDQMVVTSTEGEVAVFQGSYPEATNDWQIVGTYRIGRPLGNRAHFRGGGDIAVATSIGLIPLSKAISLDVTALSPAAVSYNIQDAWQAAVDTRGMENWICMLWPERKMAIMSPPPNIGDYDPVLFVSNSETGAWCRFTNWDARAMCVFNGEMYFGGIGGEVFKANVTGNDNGAVYTGIYIPLFDDLGSPANRKIPKMGRGVARASANLAYSLRFKSDFDIDSGAAPTAVSVDSSSTWGGGIWGEASWGGAAPTIFNAGWKSMGGSGYYVSACYQVTSGSDVPLDVEIIHLEMSMTMGEIVT